MNKLLRKANQKISLGNAAALLIVVTLIGQVLGFLRTKLVNANFPTIGPDSTDAYFAAFKIPDFFYFTIAAGALGVAFMPFLADHLARGDRKGMWRLSTSLLNLMAILTFVVGVVIFIFAEQMIGLVAPRQYLGVEQTENAVHIMRFIAFNPFLFTVSGILASVQQTLGRFFFYAIAPLFYNLCIIASIFIFKDTLGLVGLGVGALIGAILQLGIIAFGLHSSGFSWKPIIAWKDTDFRSMLKQLPARSIDQGADSINSIAETRFASRLGTGSISFYENAYILHTVPIALVGTAIATAAFPRLTARLSQGRRDLFRRDFLKILRVMIWITMPILVVSYFGRGYLARLIFTRGAPEVAVIFGFFVGAIFFRIMYALISRWFYAQKDTRTPLLISLVAISLNIYLAYTLSRPESYGVAGLALAQTIVAAVEVAILLTIMFIKDNKLFDVEFWSGFWRIMSVTGFTLLATFFAMDFLQLSAGDRGFITLGTKFGAIMAITFTVHYLVSLLFGLEEAQPIARKVKKVILKPIRILGA